MDRNKINADSADLAYVDVTITDANRVPVPNAENEVACKGHRRWRVHGQRQRFADRPYSITPQRAGLFSGRHSGIVKSTNAAGSFTVTVTADGMDPQSVTVRRRAATILR